MERLCLRPRPHARQEDASAAHASSTAQGTERSPARAWSPGDTGATYVGRARSRDLDLWEHVEGPLGSAAGKG